MNKRRTFTQLLLSPFGGGLLVHPGVQRSQQGGWPSITLGATKTWLRLEDGVDINELTELTEEAGKKEEKQIGLTIALFAVFLAVTTMLAHRGHTEAILAQSKANDQWAFYQAKNIRSHVYEANSELAALFGEKGEKLKEEFQARSEQQKKDAEEIQRQAQELENETRLMSRRAGFFDLAEIFFEVAIVLCTISLLTAAQVFWRFSFLGTLVGIGLAGWGVLLR